MVLCNPSPWNDATNDNDGDAKTDSFLGDVDYFADQGWFKDSQTELLKFPQMLPPNFLSISPSLSQLALQPDNSSSLTRPFTYYFISSTLLKHFS